MHMKFPSTCSHYFCIECMRKHLLFNEHNYHMSREPYGCPPCPNGCINPEKGGQCNCYEYDTIIELWANENPTSNNNYNDAESVFIDSADEEHKVYRYKCPLCRQKYNTPDWLSTM